MSMREIPKISTGDPSTLKTYRAIATVFGEVAVKYIDEKIAESPNGEDEIVVADERQVLLLFGSMLREDLTKPYKSDV